MQVNRIQRLIHSDNIDDIHLGYILMNDNKKFARILLQEKNLEKLYILYNDHILLYRKISPPSLEDISETKLTSERLIEELHDYLEENSKIYKHPLGYLMIINGEK